MQTFVPVANRQQIAELLDNKRLFKQAVETKQIYLALTTPGYGWQHHPAVKMWRGYEDFLLTYGMIMVTEHIMRGFCAPRLYPWFTNLLSYRSRFYAPDHPWWWGDDRIHSSHRAALYRKDPIHYSQWADETATEYWWPTDNIAAR